MGGSDTCERRHCPPTILQHCSAILGSGSGTSRRKRVGPGAIMPLTTSMQLDKYARDAELWRALAEFNYAACRVLYNAASEYRTLWFVAVTLTHNALELFLKTALIREGMTVFNPANLKALDASVGLKQDDCIWGHGLVELAKKLAARRPDFDLSATMNNALLSALRPMTVEETLALIDPFFFELRYPQELKKVLGFGGDVLPVLEELVVRLQPFINKGQP